MIDFCKIRTFKQPEINRLLNWSQTNFKPYKNHYKKDYNYFLSYSNGSARFHLDFHKVFEDGKIIGFSYVDVCFSPHYFFNDHLHNGNDFAPLQCIETIKNIIDYLQISANEINYYDVVNIEYGLNLQLNRDVPQLLNGLIYSRRTPFQISEKYSTYKFAGNSKYKKIKAYDKGIQFADYPQFKINTNTFRFEVKSKKSAFINEKGIYNLNDLLNIQKYDVLFQSIIDEWQKVLLINTTPDFKTLKPDEVQFVKGANKIQFWDDLIEEIDRKKFARYKEKYYKILKGKNNLHTEIKRQIIDKILSLQSGAYFPQKTPINTQKDINANSTDILLKGKTAPPQQNNRVCLVTKLNISMQKNTSKYLCSTGLKWYYKNDIETYQKLKDRFLTDNKKEIDLEGQIYFISHNIRNYKTNQYNNRKRFEQRNYHPNQLQLF